MKTLKEQLTPQQWEEFVEAVNEQNKPDDIKEYIYEAENISRRCDVLKYAIVWISTKQGHKYWENIYDNLK